MDRRKDWKDFRMLMSEYSKQSDFWDWRDWPGLQDWVDSKVCKYPEDHFLWRKFLAQIYTIKDDSLDLQYKPLPDDDTCDEFLHRLAIQGDQGCIFYCFMEMLLEHCLQSDDNKGLNLMFAFMTEYIAALEEELTYCEQ